MDEELEVVVCMLSEWSYRFTWRFTSDGSYVLHVLGMDFIVVREMVAYKPRCTVHEEQGMTCSIRNTH